MKIKRLVFCMLLSLVMTVSFVPASAFAVEDDGQSPEVTDEQAAEESVQDTDEQAEEESDYSLEDESYDAKQSFSSKAYGTPVDVSVTFRQSAARSILGKVNAFRTGSEAWYWNEYNTQRIWATGLAPLTYDYDLEKIAMQRAAELAVKFDHTRPDGEDCFSAYDEYDNLYEDGENIAMGQETAEDAFIAWQENGLPYALQGHRRLMLSDYGNAIGIGCVVANGTYYCAMEIADADVPNTTATAANNGAVNVRVHVNQNQVAIKSVTGRFSRTRIEVGETIGAPYAEVLFYPDPDFKDPGWEFVTTGYIWNVSWASADNSIATVNGNTIRGQSKGIAAFYANVLGVTATARIGVGMDLPFVNLPKVKLTKVKAGKKSMTVKWKKISKKNRKKIKKVQIEYSTDRYFNTDVKTVNVSSKKKSKKIKRLQKGQYYYVRIRAYTKSGDRINISNWSSIKGAKIKK